MPQDLSHILSVSRMAPLNPSARLYTPASSIYIPPSFAHDLQHTYTLFQYPSTPWLHLPPFCYQASYNYTGNFYYLMSVKHLQPPRTVGCSFGPLDVPPAICNSLGEMEAAAPAISLLGEAVGEEASAGERVVRPKGQSNKKGRRGPRLVQRYRPVRRGPSQLPPLPNELEFDDQKSTTLMIRNIPNKLTKRQLLDLLDEHCRDENQRLPAGTDAVFSEFNLMYLPIDFKSGNNLGYAFVNFTNSTGAWRLHGYLQGKDWASFRSRKVCEVSYARIQGLESLVEHFKKMPVFPSKDYLPVRFTPSRNGFGPTIEEFVGNFKEPATSW